MGKVFFPQQGCFFFGGGNIAFLKSLKNARF